MENENDSWVSFTDLMAAMMLVFVLATAVFMKKIDNVDKSKAAVFDILKKELKEVGIDPKVDPENGTIELSSKIVFDTNSARLRSEGRSYLDKLIPALATAIFHRPEISKHIVAVDIVGYSSQNIDATSFKEKMMSLSLDRAQKVWSFALSDSSFRYQSAFLGKLRVAGWGSTKSTSKKDIETDRKVVFKLQFVNPYDLENVKNIIDRDVKSIIDSSESSQSSETRS